MISRLKNQIYFLIRKWFIYFSADCTSTLPPGPVLVVAPHPDDETIGCGAAIARFCEEKQPLRIVIVTDGRASAKSARISPDELAVLRRKETLSATGKLGVAEQDVIFLGYPDGETTPFIDRISHDIAAHIAGFAPSVIFSSHPLDEHCDHRTVANILGRLQDEKKFSGVILQYPIWYRLLGWPYGILRCLLSPALYNRCRRLHTTQFQGRKAEAMMEYRSQFENLTGEEDWRFFTRDSFERFCAPEIFFEREKL